MTREKKKMSGTKRSSGGEEYGGGTPEKMRRSEGAPGVLRTPVSKKTTAEPSVSTTKAAAMHADRSEATGITEATRIKVMPLWHLRAATAHEIEYIVPDLAASTQGISHAGLVASQSLAQFNRARAETLTGLSEVSMQPFRSECSQDQDQGQGQGQEAEPEPEPERDEARYAAMVVLSVKVGSPAKAAGLCAGDFIVAVNGSSAVLQCGSIQDRYD